MNKITMDQIRKAWNDAVDALCNHDHKTRPPEMEEFFMTELNKLNHDICDIVTHMYCRYEELEDNVEGLTYEAEQLAGKLALSEESFNDSLMDNAKQKDLYLDEIEVLESSLVTARYFIFLGSMCGFLLGAACIFLVV